MSLETQRTALDAQGFRMRLATRGRTLKAVIGGEECPCVRGTIRKHRDIKEAGMLPQAATSVEIWKEDVTRLALRDRVEVILEGIKFKCLTFRDDTSATTTIILELAK